MEEKKASQSMSITGGNLSNAQVGGQAGRDLTVSQYQHAGDSDSAQLNSAEISAFLEQLKEILQASDLPDADKKKAVRSVDTAKDEIDTDEPNKEFVAQNLQRATKVLQDAGETVEAGNSLWQKIKPIFEAITPWLGTAARFLV